MSASLISKILENKQSVREIIDEAVKMNEGPLSDLADAMETDGEATTFEADTTSETTVEPQVQDDSEYRHLFVRRWRKDTDKPYKRAKVASAPEALSLYFEWLEKYKQEKVEIWSDVATDAKNFFRFCLKNREMLEDMWKGSQRTKRSGMLWPAAYKEIQAKSRQSGNNLVGTLSPFVQDAK